MLPKELFISSLQKIQEQRARISELDTALEKMCDGYVCFDKDNIYLSALLDLLKHTMDDRYDYIDWWLYEAPDAGYTIWWEEDGKEVSVDLTEAGALYEYLVESSAQSKSLRDDHEPLKDQGYGGCQQ